MPDTAYRPTVKDEYLPGSVILGDYPKPKVVAMTTFQGRVLVAREDGLFQLRGDELVKLHVEGEKP